jgi:hypothetical protein
MTKTEGRCRIDAVHVGEASFNLLGASPALSAKYAMADSTSGMRFGAGTKVQWSEQTLQKLFELAQSMEQDITRDVFDDGATTPSVDIPAANATDGVPGL